MDASRLVGWLEGTLQPESRPQCEKELENVRKIIGFAPALLDVSLNRDLNVAVRQASCIYLKNFVNNYWNPIDKHSRVGTNQSQQKQNIFDIHEQDKAALRSRLVRSLGETYGVNDDGAVKLQLAGVVGIVAKNDFPKGKWPDLADQILLLISDNDVRVWPGGLAAFQALAKHYEYKKSSERTPFYSAIAPGLMPRLLEVLSVCLDNNDKSAFVASIRKQSLKIFYAIIQHTMPPVSLISSHAFTLWMEKLLAVLLLAIPEEMLAIEFGSDADEDDIANSMWWKEKKWALHILTRIFDRYGQPGKVDSEYEQFARWYMATFSQGVLHGIMQVLDSYRRGVFVAPRVLQHCLNYIDTAVSHAVTWKIIKPFVIGNVNKVEEPKPFIVEAVIHPLMSFSKTDVELWQVDPHEYVRSKFDIFEDFISPSTAAQTLLHSICKKRVGGLEHVMHFVESIVSQCKAASRDDQWASKMDGALNMIGALSDVLLKKKPFSNQMESFLTLIVFPEFSSPCGHLRARACWMIQYLANLKFQHKSTVESAMQHLIAALLRPNEDLPVKVEAALALQNLLTSQGEKIKDILLKEQNVLRDVTMGTLELIRETENDELTSALQRIVFIYTDELAPLAVDMLTHLEATLAKVLEGDGEDGEDRAIMIVGLLNAIETLVTVMEEKKEVLALLEPIVFRALHRILFKKLSDYYEETLALAANLTLNQVTPLMWQLLPLIYEVLTVDEEGVEHFPDMMHFLHNLVTVDTEAFTANPDYPVAVVKMCHFVLELNMKDNKLSDGLEVCETTEVLAAKLLEVIILQCHAKQKSLNHLFKPIIQCTLNRLSKCINEDSVELRTMLIQVAIAALCYDRALFAQTLKEISPDALATLINQWLNDAKSFSGVHNRKIAILGLCQLMEQPELLQGQSEQRIMPVVIDLFEGIKKAYQIQGEGEDSDDDSDDSDDEDDDEGHNEPLASDEDEIDEQGQIYLESLKDKVQNVNLPGMGNISAEVVDASDSDSDDLDSDIEDDTLDEYTTPIDGTASVDEYEYFRHVLEHTRVSNASWYGVLTQGLRASDEERLKQIFKHGEKRKAAKESKNIEQAGGYNFDAHTNVPAQFAFAPSNGHVPFGQQRQQQP